MKSSVRRVTEAQPPQIRRIKQSLIGEVVNRKNDSAFLKELIITTPRAQFTAANPHGQSLQCTTSGCQSEMFQQSERGPAEEREAFKVVAVAVNCCPGEVIRARQSGRPARQQHRFAKHVTCGCLPRHSTSNIFD